VKTLAEVLQPDGTTRWEMVELVETVRKPAAEVIEEKPVKRTRKIEAAPASFEPSETPEF
jgi:malate/lactate dehydrogenase